MCLKKRADSNGWRVAFQKRMSIQVRRFRHAVFAVALMFVGLCAVPAGAQLSAGIPGFTPVPRPKKAVVAPANRTSPGLTPDEQKRLGAIINRMPAKQRRRFNKTIQKMTPEQRQQLVAVLKQQLAKAPQAGRRTK